MNIEHTNSQCPNEQISAKNSLRQIVFDKSTNTTIQAADI